MSSLPAQTPRYAIGIDLGTTNCVLSYVDHQQPEKGSQVLAIPQLDSATSRRDKNELPSFAWWPTTAEQQVGESLLPDFPAPWQVGDYARQQMAFHPSRVIHSAKSWLCHAEVDRTAAILPWQSEEIDEQHKCSPVAASALYLRWLRAAWNSRMAAEQPQHSFDQQDIVITVPASFDEAAQELTLLAAHAAGYPEGVRLLEEPQAAFYFWLGREQHLTQLHDLLEQSAQESIQVLVCDIGGGTTDLSLFRVQRDKTSRTGLALERVAVSDHLLLGGDNIDLTLAHLLEQQLTSGNQRLRARQWHQLLAQACELKERILGNETTLPNRQESFPVTLSGSGAGLFSSTLSTRVSADTIHQCVLEGFFPLCNADERPQHNPAGLREWGLPYAEDSAISRHLAAFVAGNTIDAVLFNGGSVTPRLLRERLHQLLGSWQTRTPVVLHNEALSMAVGRGAARYGWILRESNRDQRITGGHAHSLYLEVLGGKSKKEHSLVCILPKGLEAGHRVRITDQRFDLLVNQPVRFQCYFALRRQQDRSGSVLSWNHDEFRPLPPLQTAIHLPPDQPRPANNRLRVELEATLNELGLLQLYCVACEGDGRWRLDFNLRKDVVEEGKKSDDETGPPPHVNLERALPLIQAVYAKKKDPQLPEVAAKQLIKSLEKQLGNRNNWNSATLRRLWPELAAGMTRKTRSLDHENVWLYLAGFVLRPGYGVALDTSRIEELWRLHTLGMAFPKEKRIQNQWFLLWRRVAGGLNRERQQLLFDSVQPALLNQADPEAEMVYLAGALEHLSPATKRELAQRFAANLLKPRIQHKAPYFWSLGRLLSRTPLYAGRDTIVHPREVEALYTRVESLDWREQEWKGLCALFAQAARCTEQRDIDISDSFRQQLVARLHAAKATEHQIAVVDHYVPMDDADRSLQFGEALPAGLILVNRP
ncbi:MAG: Hsp70 family protein [Desulfuromonadaceae bacterium]|nr:Hsp70 family protein [Desulfuromonadaceae bacterium]